MKVAIIGAGFTGLAAGIELTDAGYQVTIFEASNRLAGLAGGFKAKGWQWSLEKYYHHVFANDEAIIKLAERIGWPTFFKTPTTSTWKDGVIAQLDSPVSLLKYPQLSAWGKLRMGMGLLVLKLIKNGVWLERYRVEEGLALIVGREGYERIWQPVLAAKFGPYLGQVNLAWFWARVAKRTKRLGYFKGGFERLAQGMAEYIKKKGGEVKLGEPVKSLVGFERVVVTVPMPLAEKLLGIRGPKLNYLWGQTLVLELAESLLPVYWLNILERDWPFLVAVEQTRMIDKKFYGGKHIVYLGNYLADGDQQLKLDEKELLDFYWPYLKQLNGELKKNWVKRIWKFQSAYAQPVFGVNYNRQLPAMKVRDGVYLANMSMVYPWDRGTNYAVELGQKVAKLIIDEG